MKCGSDQCTGFAVARWAARMSDYRATLTPVRVTFLLCGGHDEWYQEQGRGTGAVRIGLLVDEACLHSTSQREAARRDPPAGLCGPKCLTRRDRCTACGGVEPDLSDARCRRCQEGDESRHASCRTGRWERLRTSTADAARAGGYARVLVEEEARASAALDGETFSVDQPDTPVQRCACYPSGRMNLSPANGHLLHCPWYRPG